MSTIFRLPVEQIAKPEDILSLCNEVSDFLKTKWRIEQGNEVEARAQKATEYMTITGQYLADAKYHVESLLNSEFMAIVKESMSANMQTSTINKRLEVATKDFNYLVTFCDRMNRATVHELDLLKGMLFKLGQEMRANLNR